MRNHVVGSALALGLMAAFGLSWSSVPTTRSAETPPAADSLSRGPYRLVTWQAKGRWNVLAAGTGVSASGPNLDDIVEHTQSILAVNAGTKVDEISVDVVALPEGLQDLVDAAKKHRANGNKTQMDRTLDESARVLEAAGYGAPAVGDILGILMAQ